MLAQIFQTVPLPYYTESTYPGGWAFGWDNGSQIPPYVETIIWGRGLFSIPIPTPNSPNSIFLLTELGTRYWPGYNLGFYRFDSVTGQFLNRIGGTASAFGGGGLNLQTSGAIQTRLGNYYWTSQYAWQMTPFTITSNTVDVVPTQGAGAIASGAYPAITERDPTFVETQIDAAFIVGWGRLPTSAELQTWKTLILSPQLNPVDGNWHDGWNAYWQDLIQQGPSGGLISTVDPGFVTIVTPPAGAPGTDGNPGDLTFSYIEGQPIFASFYEGQSYFINPAIDEATDTLINCQDQTNFSVFSLSTGKVKYSLTLPDAITQVALEDDTRCYVLLRNRVLLLIDYVSGQVLGAVRIPTLIGTNLTIPSISIGWDTLYRRLLLFEKIPDNANGSGASHIRGFRMVPLATRLTKPIPLKVPRKGTTIPVLTQVVGDMNEGVGGYVVRSAVSGSGKLIGSSITDSYGRAYTQVECDGMFDESPPSSPPNVPSVQILCTVTKDPLPDTIPVSGIAPPPPPAGSGGGSPTPGDGWAVQPFDPVKNPTPELGNTISYINQMTHLAYAARATLPRDDAAENTANGFPGQPDIMYWQVHVLEKPGWGAYWWDRIISPTAF